MGTIKTTNIEPIANNGTVTLGSSGDTFTLGSGVVQSNLMYPAFHAYLSATQTISNDTFTVVQFNTESLDTNNAYDNSSNYRFTPQVAGKYFVYASIANNPSASNNIQQANIQIRKNDSAISKYQFASSTNPVDEIQLHAQIIVDLNGSSDYVDVRGQQAVSSGTNRFAGDTTQSRTYFGAYRIGS